MCGLFWNLNLPIVYTSKGQQFISLYCVCLKATMQPCVQVTNYLCYLMQPLQRQTALYSLFQHYFDIE